VFEERRRTVRRVLLALLTLAVFAPSAQAGGWATVGLDSTPTAKRWDVNVTVLQHGRTPLAGVEPRIEIRNGTITKSFDAKPTKREGVYRASVTFPTAGKWDYVVYDGFIANQAHSFPPVQIGAAPAGSPAAATATQDDGPRWWLAIAGIALIGLAALIVVPKRRRSHSHQPQAA
jgi:hypothetical protein